MKLVRGSVAAGSSLIYLITPPLPPSPNLASRRQRFRGKPFVNLLLVYSTRPRYMYTRKRGMYFAKRERERDCVPAIRTRDRPIIDVPYRCVALDITSTKTVPSRISTASLRAPRPLPSSSCRPPRARVPPPRSPSHPFGQLRTFLAFSSRGRAFRGKTSIKLVPLERYEALVFRLFRRHPVPSFPSPSVSPSILRSPVPRTRLERASWLVRPFMRDSKIKKKEK